jgi:hypothetical protein
MFDDTEISGAATRNDAGIMVSKDFNIMVQALNVNAQSRFIDKGLGKHIVAYVTPMVGLTAACAEDRREADQRDAFENIVFNCVDVTKNCAKLEESVGMIPESIFVRVWDGGP